MSRALSISFAYSRVAVWPIQQLIENLEELLLFWIWLPDVRIDENCIRNVTTQNGVHSRVIG